MQRYGVVRSLLGQDASEWQKAIEGTLSREALQTALEFPDSLSRERAITRDYLIQWIQDADEKQLSLWVQAATGSATLIAGIKIPIVFRDTAPDLYPEYHTCGMEMHFSAQYSSFERFKERIEESLTNIQTPRGRFTVA